MSSLEGAGGEVLSETREWPRGSMTWQAIMSITLCRFSTKPAKSQSAGNDVLELWSLCRQK